MDRFYTCIEIKDGSNQAGDQIKINSKIDSDLVPAWTEIQTEGFQLYLTNVRIIDF